MDVRTVEMIRVPVIDLRATGQNIKSMRESAGISVRELQMMLGFTNPQAIYKWQCGDSLPSIDNLVILAAVLGVTVDDILVTDGDSPGEGVGDLISYMTFTSSPEEAKKYIYKGFDAVANSIDTIVFAQAYKSMVKEIRG